MATPVALLKVLAVFTFHWNIHRVAWLREVVSNVNRYPTDTTVFIVSNEPAALTAVMQAWRLPVQVFGPKQQLDNPHMLAWEHRELIKEAFHKDNYTTFMYMEDDILVPWAAVVQWAIDTELLSTHGYQRGFYRTEIAPWNGTLMLLDEPEVVNLTTYPNKVTTHTNASTQHFIELPNPYMAMWVATRKQLERFMATKFYTQQRASPWGTREMAACNMQFVDVPAGHFSAAVVPYDPVTRKLAPNAAIAHLANNYCAKNPEGKLTRDFCTVPVTNYFD